MKQLIILILGLTFSLNIFGQEKNIPKNGLESHYITPQNDSITLGEILEKHKGKTIYIDFWATWCNPCIDEIDSSQKLKKYFKNKKVAFIYFSIDKKVRNWKKGIKKLKLDKDFEHYYLLKDARNFAKNFLKISSIPRYVIITPDGKIGVMKAALPSQFEKVKKQLSSFVKK